MSKDYLVEAFQGIGTHEYTWAMYFFKIDRRNSNPYAVYKIRFKNDDYLPGYVKSLADMVCRFQLSKIESVKDYTGENTKITCDKIRIDNELIREQWEYLVRDVIEASDERVKGKYSGYILEGISLTDKQKNMVIVKLANPVINLTNKRSVVFSFNDNNELASINDEVCKLYMDVDFVVIDCMLYAFNYKVEDMFNIEKTMQKVKQKAIEKICTINVLGDKTQFENYARAYKSPRTFLTLNTERIDRIKKKTNRKEVAEMLGIDLDNSDKFIFKNSDDAALLIRYLCYKIFKDEETHDLLEANNVSKLNLG